MEFKMATLYLTEPQTVVKKEGDTLAVHIPADEKNGRPKKKVRVPLIKIDHVVVQGNSTLTSPAIAALMERRAEVTFLSRYGRFHGHLAPAFTKNGQLRIAQHAAYHDPVRHHHLTQAFVMGKIQNMRTMLLRANRKRQRQTLAAAAHAVQQTMQQVQATVPDATTPDDNAPQTDSVYGRLQGFEGNATAHYFNNFRHLLKEPELFNGRTRRPPRDPVNALLSYGYTILLNQVASALCTVGLDPYVGYLHRSQYGKPALALDLMEEFRPLIVDSVVITVINTGMLTTDDFREEFGSFRLSHHGRKTFLTRLEARFDETITHPTFSYKATYRRSLELQARLLAKYLLDEIPAYPPFTVR